MTNDIPENNETRMFRMNWTNDEILYKATISWALDTQQPDITDQTLGRNLKDLMRALVTGGIETVPYDDRVYFRGVSDQVLETMRNDVGDFTQVQETGIGEDLAELLSGYRPDKSPDNTEAEAYLRDATENDVLSDIWNALEEHTIYGDNLSYWGVNLDRDKRELIVTLNDGSHRRRDFTIRVTELDGEVEHP